jgi:DNA ligase (NAD+)
LLEVRGEVYMTRRAFEELNARQQAAGGKRFINPRNTAAGAVRQIDPAMTAQRPLEFFAYGIGQTAGFARPESQSELLDLLDAFGFSGERRSPGGARRCRALRLLRSGGRETRKPAVRDRRRCLQGQFAGAAGQARLRITRAALGRRPQSFRPKRWRPK